MKMAANKPPQILQLTPSSEIVFEGPFDQVVTSYLELRNPSEQRVCFKVKTTAPRRYCVRPNSGIVQPNGKVKIAIMLQPIEQDSQSERSKHKFMVQSTIIQDESSNPDTVWQNATPEDIMDSKLRCVFQAQPSSAATAESSTISSTTTTIPATSKTTTTVTAPATNSTQQPQMSIYPKLQPTAGDGQNTSSRPKESEPLTTLTSPITSSPRTASSTSSTSKAWDANVSNQNLKKSNVYDADKSVASSHNLTASFLQPMSDDYKIVLVSLAMLFIGVILGKYII